MSDDTNDTAGHKTFATGAVGKDGMPTFRHEPLTRAEANYLLECAERAKADREARMPDEKSAIKALNDAYTRLTELGWGDPIYCPKDGRQFNVIELGSTGIHTAYYYGDWPSGSWFIIDEYDVWPSRPALFKLFPEDQAKRDALMREAIKMALEWE